MLLGIGVTAPAQTVPEMRLLVPISLGTPVQGGFGSVWTTQLSVVNTSDRAVFMGTSDCNPVVCDPPPAPIAANVTLKFSINNPFGTRGGYIYIDGDVAGDFHATLRVQDLSRQAETWGTTIPVVAETEFRSRKFSLLDVPVAPQFRNTLRIYGLEGTRPASVVVRTFASVPNPGSTLTHDELRSERTVIMVPTSDRYPSYAEISDLTPAAAADDPVYAVRVELEPLGGAAVWAFDSVTHNQTQHVTVIAPR
jgi:hypothetical protein